MVEIPAVEVHLDGAVFHDGQGPRGLVILGAGRGHVDLEAVRENDHRGLEFLELPGPGPVAGGKLPGEHDGVPFDDDVDVQVLMAEQQVPDKAAHHVGLELQLRGHRPTCLRISRMSLGSRSRIRESMFLVRTGWDHWASSSLGDEQVQEVGAADDADDLAVLPPPAGCAAC